MDNSGDHLDPLAVGVHRRFWWKPGTPAHRYCGDHIDLSVSQWPAGGLMNVYANLHQHHGGPDDLNGDLFRSGNGPRCAESESASETGVYFRILSGFCMSRSLLVNGRSKQMEVTVLINMAGIMGAGISAFVGVKVALAQVQRDVRNLEKSQEKAERRLDRLEERYFRTRIVDED